MTLGVSELSLRFVSGNVSGLFHPTVGDVVTLDVEVISFGGAVVNQLAAQLVGFDPWPFVAARPPFLCVSQVAGLMSPAVWMDEIW